MTAATGRTRSGKALNGPPPRRAHTCHQHFAYTMSPRGDHLLPRPVARRAVLPHVQDRPRPGPCSTTPATRSKRTLTVVFTASASRATSRTPRGTPSERSSGPWWPLQDVTISLRPADHRRFPRSPQTPEPSLNAGHQTSNSGDTVRQSCPGGDTRQPVEYGRRPADLRRLGRATCPRRSRGRNASTSRSGDGARNGDGVRPTRDSEAPGPGRQRREEHGGTTRPRCSQTPQRR